MECAGRQQFTSSMPMSEGVQSIRTLRCSAHLSRAVYCLHMNEYAPRFGSMSVPGLALDPCCPLAPRFVQQWSSALIRGLLIGGWSGTSKAQFDHRSSADESEKARGVMEAPLFTRFLSRRQRGGASMPQNVASKSEPIPLHQAARHYRAVRVPCHWTP
jgi:hypothetical protein